MTAIFIKTKNVTGVGSPKQASEDADPDLQIRGGGVGGSHPDPGIRGGARPQKKFF